MLQVGDEVLALLVSNEAEADLTDLLVAAKPL
jgi:hypothetical protein